MTEWEKIDFNNHIQVAIFLQKQSDRIKELEKENEELYCSIDFLQSENKHLQECILQNNELKATIKLIEKNHDNFYDKVFSLIDNKISEMESDLNRAVKAGMGTMCLYDEIDLLSELKKEMQE